MQETKKLGFVVFDIDLEFILVKISDEMYDIPVVDTTITNKYHEVIAVIKEFMDRFGKKMDCWEQFLEYDGISFYSIKTDLEEINVDDNDDYDIISIEDFNNVDCSDRLKWIAYMALDRKVRKAKLSVGNQQNLVE